MSKEKSSRTQREALSYRIGISILDMLRSLEERREKAAKTQGLHPTDFACIAFLDAQDAPVSPKQVASWLRLTSGSSTALLDRLEQVGYVRRLPNPEDRRGVLIELDRAAAAAPIAQYHEMQADYRRRVDTFTDDEMSVVARFLESFGSATRDGG